MARLNGSWNLNGCALGLHRIRVAGGRGKPRQGFFFLFLKRWSWISSKLPAVHNGTRQALFTHADIRIDGQLTFVEKEERA